MSTESGVSLSVADTSEADGSPLWLTGEEQSAWRAQIRLSKLLVRQLDRDLQPFGLNTNDYEILVELSEAPDHRLRMTELADATAQSRSRLSHQITRMEARGMVRRDTCEGDKRGMFAVITERGLETISLAAPSHVDSVRRHFIGRLTSNQLDVIKQAYEPVVNELRKIRDRD